MCNKISETETERQRGTYKLTPVSHWTDLIWSSVKWVGQPFLVNISNHVTEWSFVSVFVCVVSCYTMRFPNDYLLLLTLTKQFSLLLKIAFHL